MKRTKLTRSSKQTKATRPASTCQARYAQKRVGTYKPEPDLGRACWFVREGWATRAERNGFYDQAGRR